MLFRTTFAIVIMSSLAVLGACSFNSPDDDDNDGNDDEVGSSSSGSSSGGSSSGGSSSSGGEIPATCQSYIEYCDVPEDSDKIQGCVDEVTGPCADETKSVYECLLENGGECTNSYEIEGVPACQDLLDEYNACFDEN